MLFLYFLLLSFFTQGGGLPELSGLISITHEVNFNVIGKHLATWRDDTDSLQLNGKLLSMVFSHKINQLSGLLGSVTAEFNISSQDIPALNDDARVTPKKENYVIRQKRNFLGNILHDLTRVATEEQLEAQLKLDHEIRDTVTQLLAHQVRRLL